MKNNIRSLKKLSFAIVGVGYWGPNYARILSELPDTHLIWCCDKDINALSKMKQRYPGIRTTTEYKEVIADQAIDCMIIVTPAEYHYQITRDALNAGKDVLVEKPLSNNVLQAKKLVALAKKTKRILAVDHTYKFNAAIIKLKEYIDKGELGEIYYMYGLYNALGPIRKDVSAMWDLSPHFIYVSNYLLGKLPHHVSAIGRSFLMPGMEDVVFLNLEYDGGAICSLHSSWLDPVKVRQLVVVGSKKMAVFNDLSLDTKLSIYDKSAAVHTDPNFANLSIILRSGSTVIPTLEEKEPLKEVLIDFISAVFTRENPTGTVEEGYDVVRILSALQYSLEHTSKRVILTEK